MNDCPNAEIRDRLPDLLHEHLDAGARAQVMAHVERCADCRAELALLREARSLLATAPLVDVGRIVRALPSPAAARLARVSTRSRRLTGASPRPSRRSRSAEYRSVRTRRSGRGCTKRR